MFNSKDSKIKLEFLRHSIKSMLPSYWFVIGLFITISYYLLSIWDYKVESNIIATVNTVSSSHGYGDSSFRVSAEYEKSKDKINIIVDLPPGVTLHKGDKFIVAKHYRYLLPDNFTYVSK